MPGKKFRQNAALKTKCLAADLYEAIMEGAVSVVRPKMMTVVAIMAGLLPILLEGTGTGSEVMSHCRPMVGGMISSTKACLMRLASHAQGTARPWHPGGQETVCAA